jgi:hypothetical protein
MTPRPRAASTLLASILLASCLAAACGDDGPTFADAGVEPDAATTTRIETKSVPLATALDVLLVVDNSNSMGDEQQALIAGLPDFIEVLENLDGGLPDIHIGVVSTDVGAGPFSDASCPLNGDDGALLVPDSRCGITTGESFLRSAPTADGRATNFGGSLTDAFGCMAALGVNGCGFEQPLEAVRRALEPGANEGFRRPGALLAIVFLTDEDDCSAMDDGLYTPDETVLGPRSSFRCFEYGVTCRESGRGAGDRTACTSDEDGPYLASVASFARFLRDLGGPGSDDDSALVLAGIYGVDVDTRQPAPIRVGPSRTTLDPELQPVCERDLPGGASTAAPGVRLAQFFDAFPGQVTETSICDDSYGDSLFQLATRVRRLRGLDCIGGELADLDPVTAGAQIECSVSDVTAPGTADERSIDVPSCETTGNTAPCWRLATDAAACPDGAHQAIEVLRATTSLPPGTFQRRQCTLER